MADDLRTLAQAVVDAWGALAGTHGIEYLCAQQTSDDASDALEEALECGHLADADSTARAILAALDAERAQGYARAMGEVVERCEATVADNAKGRRGDPYTMGLCDEMDRVADWARERLPAADERD